MQSGIKASRMVHHGSKKDRVMLTAHTSHKPPCSYFKQQHKTGEGLEPLGWWQQLSLTKVQLLA